MRRNGARAVLRGGGGGDLTSLPDQNATMLQMLDRFVTLAGAANRELAWRKRGAGQRERPGLAGDRGGVLSNGGLDRTKRSV